MIKYLVKAASLLVLILFVTGCTKTRPPVVEPGATQYPREIKPLIFVNFSIKTGWVFRQGGFAPRSPRILPWGVHNVWIQNEKTHEYTGLLFGRKIGVSGSMNVPYKVDSNTLYTSAFITLPPGDYIMHRIVFDIKNYVGTPPVTDIVWKKNPLRFTVPDKDFCSLGTVSIEIDPPEGNVAWLNAAGRYPFKVHGSLRTISSPEKDFAVQTYPFLKDLNLTP